MDADNLLARWIHGTRTQLAPDQVNEIKADIQISPLVELIQWTEHLEKGFQTALFPLVEDSERKSWPIGKAFQVRLAEPLKV
jgi:hypothetical protein